MKPKQARRIGWIIAQSILNLPGVIVLAFLLQPTWYSFLALWVIATVVVTGINAYALTGYGRGTGTSGKKHTETTLTLAERALSETVVRLAGYDWNADPDNITRLQGEAFAALKEAQS